MTWCGLAWFGQVRFGVVVQGLNRLGMVREFFVLI